MEKEYNDKDPERMIFRTALNSYKIEPSDKFWNSALHGIIDKEGAINKRRIRTWKGISFGLASVLAVFCLHDVLMYNKMDKIQDQLTVIKNNQDKLQEQVTKQVTVANSNTLVNTNALSKEKEQNAASNKVVVNNTVQEPMSVVNKTGSYMNNNVVVAERHRNKNTASSYISTVSKSVVNPPYPQIAPQVPEKGDAQVKSGNSGNIAGTQNGAEQPGIPNNNPVVSSMASVTTQNGDVGTDAKKTTDVHVNDTAQNTSKPISKNDEPAVTKQSINDSLALLALKETPPKSKFSLKHKVSFSAFFAPGGSNDFLRDKDNDNTDNITANSLKARQSDLFAYQVGVKAGVDISDRFRLQTGLYYHIYSYNIGENILTAKEQADGDVGYSMVTSSGVVDIPYPGPVKEGDSIKVHGSSSRGYICIPLQLSYTIVSHNKWGFYAIGGMAANIAAFSGTTVNWQNTLLQEGSASASTIEGLSKVHYSYNLGLGLTYKLGKGFSVYAEPFLQGSITSINSNTPVTTYPFFFGGAVGLTYHL